MRRSSGSWSLTVLPRSTVPAAPSTPASLQLGSPGVLHGNRTYILQDDNGQITETHSISDLAAVVDARVKKADAHD